jgi:hypothetical protein
MLSAWRRQVESALDTTSPFSVVFCQAVGERGRCAAPPRVHSWGGASFRYEAAQVRSRRHTSNPPRWTKPQVTSNYSASTSPSSDASEWRECSADPSQRCRPTGRSRLFQLLGVIARKSTPLVHSELWVPVHSRCGTLGGLQGGHKRKSVHAFERISGTYRLTDAAANDGEDESRLPERGLEDDIALTSSPSPSPITRKSCRSDCSSMRGSPRATSG